MNLSTGVVAQREQVPLSAPVSLQQQRFWLLDRLFPGNPAYNIAVRWRLTGKLDPKIVEDCINAIISRQEILRTRFVMHNDVPIQIIEPHLTVIVPLVDLSRYEEAQRTIHEERFTLEEARRQFDLTKLPLIRARLLRLAEEEHILLVTFHHIVSDGWSVGVFVDELAALYPAFANGEPSPLPDLPLNYRDYAMDQSRSLENSDNPELAYWKRTLANMPRFEVPSDRVRPSVQTSHGDIVSLLLPKNLTETLSGLCVQQGVTLFMAAFAALNAMLCQWTGKEDVVLGTPVAGRGTVESESLIGAFINVLVLRSDLSGNPTVLEMLKRTRNTIFGALANQALPFERLVDELRPQRNLSFSPLFSVNFIFQRAFVRNQTFQGVSLIDIPSRSPGAIYDLNFFMVERIDGWRVSCEYNTDLYDANTIERMLHRYKAILKAFGPDPHLRLSELPMLDGSNSSPEESPAIRYSPNELPGVGQQNTNRAVAEPRTLLERQLANLWKEALRIEVIGIDEDFFNLGANSLKAVALLPRISRLIGREVALMTIFANPTIRDLARVLEFTPDRSEGNATVAIQPLGGRPPFFFIEAEPRLLKLKKFFATYFAPDQPILSPIADEALAAARPYDLKANAAYHVDSILRARPEGPYYLGGYSAGGIMAFEIAQQLWARGREVALLVLFDTANPHHMGEYSRFQRLKARHEARLATLRARRLNQMPRFLASRLLARLGGIGIKLRRTAYKLNITSHIRADDPPEDLFWVRRSAARYYKPETYPGRVVLFKGISEVVSRRYREESYGWAAIVKGGLEVSVVQSDHLDMFDETIVEPIALGLRDRLTAIQSERLRFERPSAQLAAIG